MNEDKYLKKHNNSYYFSDDLNEAPIKIGTRIMKRNSEEGDNVSDGMKGKVIGSISQLLKADGREADYCYAVIWDDEDVAIGIMGKKIEIDKSVN